MTLFNDSKSGNVYFDSFIEFTSKAREAARLLDELANDYTDVDDKVAAIKIIEHECDIIVHDIMSKLVVSFVTPLEREDIDKISQALDNIVDNIESTAQTFLMYNVLEITDHVKMMTRLITDCTKSLQELMCELKVMKKSKIIHQIVVDINSLQNDGEDQYRTAVRELFRSDSKPIEILIWKDIYATLKNAIDACEDVANLVEGVVMRNA